MVAGALLVAAAAPGHADTIDGTRVAGGSAKPTETSLDGTYVALGPMAAATHTDGAWDGAFGGELTVVRVREQAAVAALGGSLGAYRYATQARGRAWADLLIGTRRPFDIAWGLSVGAVAELDEVRPARPGVHASLWIFAGVLPYVRVGAVEKTGPFIDVGIKVALPAIRL